MANVTQWLHNLKRPVHINRILIYDFNSNYSSRTHRLATTHGTTHDNTHIDRRQTDATL